MNDGPRLELCSGHERKLKALNDKQLTDITSLPDNYIRRFELKFRFYQIYSKQSIKFLFTIYYLKFNVGLLFEI